METSAAVYVQNACKSYGKKEILKELCMQVKKGTIYGLLGASGCGKTTLLGCIVGRKKLNSGEIFVLGGKPGMEGSGVPGPRVGYMPQDIALVGEFTVKDALFYFGRILNMPDKLIDERFRNLSKLLDLPPDERLIKNCSGGQQRRVSFACAMVHMPELLILDEPTVGVDPVLRERIWNYLVELTNTQKTTVIITTHYIEEARKANTIGLMRDGKLLAEESPSNLLSMFRTDSLEEVFLILSQRQEEGQLQGVAFQTSQMGSDSIMSFDIDHGGSTDVLTKKQKKKTPKPVSSLSLNPRRVKALMNKNWKQFYRNIAGVLFILLFPVLEILAFLLAIGADIKDINVAIVNDESMTTLCPDFKLNGSAVPYSWSSCHLRNMSCRFLNYLENPMINKVQYSDLEKAKDDAIHGKIVGILYIPKNFTDSFEKRIEDGSNVDAETVNFGEMKVWLDMSNRQIGATIKYKLYSLYEDFQEDLFRDCNFDPKLKDYIHLQTIYGNRDDIFTIFMTPGVVLTIMFFMGAVMTSQIIITDRCEGVWDRSTIAGVSSLEITLTHFFLQACLVLIHTFEVLIITFALFKIDYTGSMWTMALLAFLQGVAGMSYGFWVSVISYNHSMANIVTTGSFYPMILVCGLVWPLEAMPTALQWISKCLPFTIAITSFRNVMKKGWSINHLQVLNGLAVEIVWIIALLVLTIFLVKSKR